jgi:hypothetical protein
MAVIRSPDWKNINSQKELKEQFGGTAYVYAPYILWRSGHIWEQLQSVKISSEIRKILEQTYSPLPDDVPQWVCDAYDKLINERDSLREHALAAMSQRILPLDDNEENLVATRYGNRRERQVLFLSEFDKGSTAIQFSGTTLDNNKLCFNNNNKNIPRIQAINANLNCLRIPEYSLQGIKSQWWAQKLADNNSVGLVMGDDGRLCTPEGESSGWCYNNEIGLYREEIMSDNNTEVTDEFDW